MCDPLGDFYREWSRHVEIVRDRSLPVPVRMIALHWIDEAIGEPPTDFVDLETVANELDI